jgi:hypothetical protein
VSPLLGEPHEATKSVTVVDTPAYVNESAMKLIHNLARLLFLGIRTLPSHISPQLPRSQGHGPLRDRGLWLQGS